MDGVFHGFPMFIAASWPKVFSRMGLIVDGIDWATITVKIYTARIPPQLKSCA